MSSFGSSLINKSGRKVAPKLGARRKLPQPAKPAPVLASSESENISRDASEQPVPSTTDVSEVTTERHVPQSGTPATVDLQSTPGAIPTGRISRITPPSTLESVQEQPDSEGTHDSPDQNPKRRKLDGKTERSESNRLKGPSFVAAVSKPHNEQLSSTRPRTTQQLNRDSNQLPAQGSVTEAAASPSLLIGPSSQRTTRQTSQTINPRPSAPGIVQYETPSSAVSTNKHPINSDEDEDDDEDDDGGGINWVITTPAQISKAGRQRTGPRGPGMAEQGKKGTTAESSAVNGTEAAKSSTTAGKSARLANRDRRKQRREQLTAAMGSGAPAAAEDVDHQEDNEAEGEQTSTISRKKRQRAPTPEESETVTIVPSMVTMFELASRDRRTGQKSEREKRMRQINWTEVKRRRHEEEVRLAKAGRRRQKTTEQPENEQEDQEVTPTAQRVRVRIVNGEHVFENLRVDRHALANEDIDTLEEVEAHNETDHFNSHTYVRLKRREVAERMPTYDKWTADATDKFFDCLSRFGTDFMVITHMFPTRTRRQIKAKYTREERLSPERIRQALENYDGDRPHWDLGVFQENSGWEGFKDPRQVEQELKALREEEEKNIEEKRKEVEEIRRQRRLAGDISEDEEAAEAGASSKAKNSTRHTITIGGDELEIVAEG